MRDSILKGDLLYNPLFKKNAKDHVVLVGIFDTDADGIDDVVTLARDLAKRGAIVDGYFDLSTNKWESLDPNNAKPGPGPNTTYVVRGWEFDATPGHPLNAQKGALRVNADIRPDPFPDGTSWVQVGRSPPQVWPSTLVSTPPTP